MLPDNSVLYKSRAGYDRAMRNYDDLLAKLTVSYDTSLVETRHGMISESPAEVNRRILEFIGGQ